LTILDRSMNPLLQVGDRLANVSCALMAPRVFTPDRLSVRLGGLDLQLEHLPDRDLRRATGLFMLFLALPSSVANPLCPCAKSRSVSSNVT
jgi:hypothetical protein